MVIFEVKAKKNGKIKLTEERETHIVMRHPEMLNKSESIRESLVAPELIKESAYDSQTWIYYRQHSTNDYIAVVAKIKNDSGFVITSYIAEIIKEGKIIWKKN